MSTSPQILDHIHDSIQALLEGKAGGDLMFFAGSQQEAIPTALFLDPTLRPVDRNLWVVLRLSMRSQGGRQAAFPSYEDLEKVWRVGVKDTLSISYALLRLRGWITRCQTVRDAEGRYRGQVWMVNDEPSPLAEIIEIDPGYMAFWQECRNHRSTRIRHAAIAMDAAMTKAIDRGEDVTAHTATVSRRLESLRARAKNDGIFYGVELSILDDLSKSAHPDQDQPPSPIIRLGLINPVRLSDLAHPGPIIGLNEKSDSAHPGPIIGPDDNSLINKENDAVLKNGTDHALCSSSSKTTTTTEAKNFPDQLKSALTSNELSLIDRYLSKVSQTQRQDILEYLTERLAKGQVEKPVPFVFSLVKAAKEGLFYRHLKTPSAPPPTQAPPPETVMANPRQRLFALSSDATGLRRLLEGTHDPVLQAQLNAQLAAVEQQINSIKTGV